jgi:sugar phosphate isomerase/epimerase
MLLTLAANSFRKRLQASRSAPDALALTDLPAYAREQLGLFGLNVTTDLLAGADHHRLDKLREAADKASCPCLVLIEPAALPFADTDDTKGDAAISRMRRVVQAAHRLGCNSAAVGVSDDTNPDAIEYAADRLKRVLQGAERMEVNLLLLAQPGLTGTPEHLTDLIKKIGGFRIGTFPDFQTAANYSDPVHFLRRLTPYASAVTASVVGFKEAKKSPGVTHEPYDLVEYVKIIESVGYQGTLAIDYRGEGDPEKGVRNARDVLTWALGEGSDDLIDDDDLPDLDDAEDDEEVAAKTESGDDDEEEDEEEGEEAEE